jgi:RNA polymerase sigma-70 factor, ECF subfamily
MEESIGRNRLKELENVITEFQEQLFRFAFFRTGFFADAQDIVQDVFIKLYHDKVCLNTVHNLKNYLFRSVSNACIDYQRKKGKYKFSPLDKATIPDDMNEKEASHQMLLVEEYSRIELLLKNLPDEQAEVIRLKVLDDLSFVEIAQIFQIPVTTIKSRFKYGIDKLKLKVYKTKGVIYGM